MNLKNDQIHFLYGVFLKDMGDCNKTVVERDNQTRKYHRPLLFSYPAT